MSTNKSGCCGSKNSVKGCCGKCNGANGNGGCKGKKKPAPPPTSTPQ